MRRVPYMQINLRLRAATLDWLNINGYNVNACIRLGMRMYRERIERRDASMRELAYITSMAEHWHPYYELTRRTVRIDRADYNWCIANDYIVNRFVNQAISWYILQVTAGKINSHERMRCLKP